jgi:RNA polymerase sigma-70 factor, ECF subfamily
MGVQGEFVMAALTVTEMPDDALLAAIAANRDQEAFSVLLQKYRHAAFSLAVYIAGSKDLAEEVVQDAMLSVWNSAHTFKSTDARAWIMRIVARRALKIARQSRRSSSILKKARESMPKTTELVDSDEKQEMLAAVRSALGDLDPKLRKLVALHYGAGFTHQEIADETGIPRRTISMQLSSLLNDLRNRLKLVAPSIALPLIGSEVLAEAVHTSEIAPAMLSSRVIEALKAAPEAPTESPRHAPAPGASGGGASLWLGTGLGVIVLGGILGAYFLSQESENSSTYSILEEPAESQAVKVEPSAVPVAPPPQSAFRHVWTFEKDPVGLKVHRGSWKRSTTSDVMEVADGATIIPEPETPKRPFMLRVVFCSPELPGTPVKFNIGSFWWDPANPPGGKTIFAIDSLKVDVGTWYDEQFIFYEKYLYFYRDNDLLGVAEADNPYPRDHISLQFNGRIDIRRIELRELKQHEIRPEFLRPPEELRPANLIRRN